MRRFEEQAEESRWQAAGRGGSVLNWTCNPGATTSQKNLGWLAPALERNYLKVTFVTLSIAAYAPQFGFFGGHRGIPPPSGAGTLGVEA